MLLSSSFPPPPSFSSSSSSLSTTSVRIRRGVGSGSIPAASGVAAAGVAGVGGGVGLGLSAGVAPGFYALAGGVDQDALRDGAPAHGAWLAAENDLAGAVEAAAGMPALEQHLPQGKNIRSGKEF